MNPASVDSLVIAVDGPSGSGKSSVSREVARRLSLSYLDTGAMYRALAWYCRHLEIALDDRAAVAAAALELPLTIGTDPDEAHVDVGGHDITLAIRESAVSAVVSLVAGVPEVRTELIARQRAVISYARESSGIVAEGRDITTVVAPDADVRVLLVASEEARLRRRARELHGAADERAVERTRDEVVRRDRDDSKVTSFMQPAPGVRLLDTSDLDFEESVAALLAIVRECAADSPAEEDTP